MSAPVYRALIAHSIARYGHIYRLQALSSHWANKTVTLLSEPVVQHSRYNKNCKDKDHV